jgi:diguanylate cyclase (GGDEF)-like protein
MSLAGRIAVLVAALAFVLGTGWLDFVTGPEYSLGLFYVAPVVAVGMVLGGPSALVMACFTASVWAVADLLPREPLVPRELAWNGLSRFAVLALIGQIMGRMRHDRDQLASVNARLQRLLAGETELARTDPLTGLKNCRGFRELLELEIARSGRAGTPLCLAYVDIDNFKNLNDVDGHAAGDAFLQQVAAALREAVRAGDVPARLGGDEFGVLLTGVNVELAQRVAERLLAKVNEVTLAYPERRLGASVGVAYFERVPDDADALIAAADLAMYQAKERGKGQVALWVEGRPVPLAKAGA